MSCQNATGGPRFSNKTLSPPTSPGCCPAIDHWPDPKRQICKSPVFPNGKTSHSISVYPRTAQPAKAQNPWTECVRKCLRKNSMAVEASHASSESCSVNDKISSLLLSSRLVRLPHRSRELCAPLGARCYQRRQTTRSRPAQAPEYVPKS